MRFARFRDDPRWQTLCDRPNSRRALRNFKQALEFWVAGVRDTLDAIREEAAGEGRRTRPPDAGRRVVRDGDDPGWRRMRSTASDVRIVVISDLVEECESSGASMARSEVRFERAVSRLCESAVERPLDLRGGTLEFCVPSDLASWTREKPWLRSDRVKDAWKKVLKCAGVEEDRLAFSTGH